MSSPSTPFFLLSSPPAFSSSIFPSLPSPLLTLPPQLSSLTRPPKPSHPLCSSSLTLHSIVHHLPYISSCSSSFLDRSLSYKDFNKNSKHLQIFKILFLHALNMIFSAVVHLFELYKKLNISNPLRNKFRKKW